MSLQSINPATGSSLTRYEEMDSGTVALKLSQTAACWQEWRGSAMSQRGDMLRTVAAQLRMAADELARLMALEMGKPLAQGRAEVEKCAWTCEFVAQHAAGWLRPEQIPSEARRSCARFEPLGPLLAVMPWNFPLWQVFRCAAPALMAGNTVVLKHASNVSGCSLWIEEIFRQAGLPEGAFLSLLVAGENISAAIADPRIRGVALTGSTPAGRSVAAKAGAALKKCVLELGGSDPYLILQDADLAKATESCAASRMINGGQSCIAAKRFIVLPSVHDEFVERLTDQLAGYAPCDPLLENARLGPMARLDLRNALHEQVERSVRSGARLSLGGVLPSGPGAYYPPTLLTGVRPGMAAFDEETFGPVAAVTLAKTEAEAIELANATPFGLGAAIFSQDLERAEALASKLEAGNCFINAFVRSDPRLPFGGIKDSGYGRELSVFGIREFTNIKTVYVA